MADPILFESLDDTPTGAPPAAAAGVLVLQGWAFDDLDALGASCYGELPLLAAPGEGETPLPPAFGIVEGELLLVPGYMYAPEVAGDAELEGELPLLGIATESTGYCFASLPLSGSAAEAGPPPIDTTPFIDLDEWALLGDQGSVAQTTVARSGMAGTDLLSVIANRMATASDAVRLRDTLRLLLEATAVDSVALADVVAGNPRVTVALADSLRLLGVVQGNIAALAVVSDLAALAEAVRSVQDADAEDGAALADTLEGLVRALEVVVTTAAFSDTVQGLAMVTAVVPDGLAIADSVAGQGIYQALVNEQVQFAVSFTLDGVPYVGLSMNTANRAVTEYEAFNYNSLARFNGRLYAAGAAGLFRLEGDTDDGEPIAAYLRMAKTMLAGGKATRVTDAYIGFRSNGGLQLKVVATDPTTKKLVGYVYDLRFAPSSEEQLQTGMFDVGRGIKSVYTAFELSNVAGADFALDVFQVRPLALDRRLS